MHFQAKNVPKINGSWGLVPDPITGAYNAPQTQLLDLGKSPGKETRKGEKIRKGRKGGKRKKRKLKDGRENWL